MGYAEVGIGRCAWVVGLALPQSSPRPWDQKVHAKPLDTVCTRPRSQPGLRTPSVTGLVVYNMIFDALRRLFFPTIFSEGREGR